MEKVFAINNKKKCEDLWGRENIPLLFAPSAGISLRGAGNAKDRST
jgi:hypothetical protein